MSWPKSSPARGVEARSSSSVLNVPSSAAAFDHGHVLGGRDVPAALRLLLRQVRRGQQAARELVG